MQGFNDNGLVNEIKASSANVIVLSLGGNDLDAERPNGMEDPYGPRKKILMDILALFRELENAGKTVFVLQLPNRYSTRVVETYDEYNQASKYINSKLKKTCLFGRQIAIPSNYFNKSVYEGQWNRKLHKMEYVHFNDQTYNDIATGCFDHILQDLRLRSSPPSGLKTDRDFFKK